MFCDNSFDLSRVSLRRSFPLSGRMSLTDNGIGAENNRQDYHT
jgi:hypothetical protein